MHGGNEGLGCHTGLRNADLCHPHRPLCFVSTCGVQNGALQATSAVLCFGVISCLFGATLLLPNPHNSNPDPKHFNHSSLFSSIGC